MAKVLLKQFISTIAILLLMCSIALASVWGLSRWAPIAGRSADAAADNFVLALRHNDLELAKGLAIAEQHTRIEQFIHQHQTVTCPIHQDWDLNESWSGSGASTSDDQQAIRDWGYLCLAADYSFNVVQMKLEKRGFQWWIIDWDKICERYGEQVECQ